MVNLTKSEVVLTQLPLNIRKHLASLLGIGITSNPGKYLGLPTCYGGFKKALLTKIRESIQGRLSGWQSKLLSPAGKEVLIKSVAQAIPIIYVDFDFPKRYVPLEGAPLCHSRKNVSSKGKSLMIVCPICLRMETIEHLFLDCPWTQVFLPDNYTFTSSSAGPGPPLGVYKINCDGAFNSSNHCGASGVLIRDHVGIPLVARDFCFRAADYVRRLGFNRYHFAQAAGPKLKAGEIRIDGDFSATTGDSCLDDGYMKINDLVDGYYDAGGANKFHFCIFCHDNVELGVLEYNAKHEAVGELNIQHRYSKKLVQAETLLQICSEKRGVTIGIRTFGGVVEA
ncbi:hypothetical protein FNV43_RR14659 [Rhamnella rubrinervis]|uniref:Reverse transcriptase zinc-binding domain-containing protein n=1 Tax=Rhamnella rubrinervis TaxID=2594499 RepID=A0A8K0MGF8_9ROSA|nr:hypothetical protein FNV43_RR14659 [Rhamnella rubrinervis]